MNNSTERIKNLKNFEKELASIQTFGALSNFNIEVIGYENISARLNKRGKEFCLQMDARLDDEEGTNKFSFPLNNIIYELKKFDYSFSSTEFNEDSAPKFSTTYEIKTVQTRDFDFTAKGTFVSFYPIDIDELKTFHTEFETVTHQRAGREYFYDCIRINVQGVDYDILQLKTGDKGFYVFECLSEETFKNYTDICYSIRQAIGFVNRLMVGDEEFIFDKSGKMYYSNYIRPTVKGFYSPVTTNPYSNLDVDRKCADEIFEKLTRITSKNLSELVLKIHTNEDFSAAIVIILEATSIHSLLLIPSSFAVVVELLSKTLSIEEVGLEVPIENNDLKKKIMDELISVLDSNSASLSSKAILKLKRRLTEINRPINKEHLTNNEKLTRPFEQLDINLTLHDIEVIEHRNDLLHGNVLLKSEERQSKDSTNLYMAYVSAKLFTLISKLILKSVGYNGYVYNQAKYLEKHLEMETIDEYFERV